MPTNHLKLYQNLIKWQVVNVLTLIVDLYIRFQFDSSVVILLIAQYYYTSIIIVQLVYRYFYGLFVFKVPISSSLIKFAKFNLIVIYDSFFYNA